MHKHIRGRTDNSKFIYYISTIKFVNSPLSLDTLTQAKITEFATF